MFETVSLEIINRASENRGKLITPVEIKNVKPFYKFKFERDKNISLFIDNNKNLWYKDLKIGVGAVFDDNQNKVTYYVDRGFIKITGLYKVRKEHFLDVLRYVINASEEYYTGNDLGDNLYLERIYEIILKKYLEEIKGEE